MFGSNLKLDRNVPAGDNFVKIDVNRFPVLTLHKERNSNSLSFTHTQTHTHVHRNQMAGKIYEILFFVLSKNTLLIENHPSS